MHVCNYSIPFSFIWGGEQPASINLLFSDLFYIGGKFGSNCFMAISAFYLLDSKFKIQRATSIWKTTFFYGVLFFCLNAVCHFESVGIRDILETIFLVSYKAYWYVTAYVAIILIAPFLNYVIERITEKQYKFWLCVLLAMVTVPAIFLPMAKPYYDESHVVLFVLVYLLIGFYKNGYLSYSKIFALKCIIIGFTWLIVSPILIIGAGVLLENNAKVHYSTFGMNGESLPMILASVGIIIFVFELPMKSNNLINKWSKGSFDIYLIHMNYFIYEWIWCTIFPVAVLINKRLSPVYIILITLLIFIIALVIGNIRCLVSKKIERIINFK